MTSHTTPPYHHPGVFSTDPRETNVTNKAEETVDEGPIGEWGRRREAGEGGRRGKEGGGGRREKP